MVQARQKHAAPKAAAPAETQATAAYRRLRADIVCGRLVPGMKLKVHALAEAYGAGPAPLREALAQLAAEGLALRVEQRGFRVRALDAGAFQGLIRTRCLVEGLALRESILHGDAGWEDAVAGAEQRMARLSPSLEADRFVANLDWEVAHQAFHRALVSACAAPPLVAFCEKLREEADRYRAIANVASFPQRDVAAEHAAIARATLRRDAERATALLVEHLSITGDFVRVALATKPSAAPAAKARRARGHDGGPGTEPPGAVGK